MCSGSCLSAHPQGVFSQSQQNHVSLPGRPNGFHKAAIIGSENLRTFGHRPRLKGEVSAAIELYKQSILLDPYFTPAYSDLALVFSMLNDRNSVLEMLDRTLTIDPRSDAASQERRKLRPCPLETKCRDENFY
jgi:hypothetical protein